jgi:hypothetical protein
VQAYDDHTARQRMEWRWPKGQLYLLIGEPD